MTSDDKPSVIVERASSTSITGGSGTADWSTWTPSRGCRRKLHTALLHGTSTVPDCIWTILHSDLVSHLHLSSFNQVCITNIYIYPHHKKKILLIIHLFNKIRSVIEISIYYIIIPDWICQNLFYFFPNFSTVHLLETKAQLKNKKVPAWSMFRQTAILWFNMHCISVLPNTPSFI